MPVDERAGQPTETSDCGTGDHSAARRSRRPRVAIEKLTARAYVIPTDRPEADGTIAWDATTLVLVEIAAAGMKALGYTYAAAAAAGLVREVLAPIVIGQDAMAIGGTHAALRRQMRNIGWPGVAACAVAAVDVALFDLKAKLLDLPLALLLGQRREAVPIYGSGGFTTYDDATLQRQFAAWVERDGCRWVKMKIGSEPSADPGRVAAARAAIGDRGLLVDANGAFTFKQALAMAERLTAAEVTWFEEPVSSDDLEGLRLMRERGPAGMEIAAGEYGYDPAYFRRMLAAGAVDVQQADATRCGGITGFMAAAGLCDAFGTDLSAHCAPALHLHAACAAPRFRHQEWFHDHVRIEAMLFDGAPRPRDGLIAPDLSRPGLGVAFKHADAERYLAA